MLNWLTSDVHLVMNLGGSDKFLKLLSLKLFCICDNKVCRLRLKYNRIACTLFNTLSGW